MNHGCLMILNGCVMTRSSGGLCKNNSERPVPECVRKVCWNVFRCQGLTLQQRWWSIFAFLCLEQLWPGESYTAPARLYSWHILRSLWSPGVNMSDFQTAFEVCLIMVISGNLTKYWEYNSSCTFNTNDESSCSLLRRGGLCHKLPTTLPTHISVPWHPPRTP